MVIECIRPKLDRKRSTKKEGTNAFGGCPVSTFNRSILVTTVSAGRIDFESTVFEDSTNVRVTVEFTALIHMNILVKTMTVAWAILLEEIADVLEGSCF